jgi:hypothetical protein
MIDARPEFGFENIAPGGLSPSFTFAPSRAILELIEPTAPGDESGWGSAPSFPTSACLSLAILSAIVEGLDSDATVSPLWVALASFEFVLELSPDPAAVIIGAFELFRLAMRSRTDISQYAFSLKSWDWKRIYRRNSRVARAARILTWASIGKLLSMTAVNAWSNFFDEIGVMGLIQFDFRFHHTECVIQSYHRHYFYILQIWPL